MNIESRKVSRRASGTDRNYRLTRRMCDLLHTSCTFGDNHLPLPMAKVNNCL